MKYWTVRAEMDKKRLLDWLGLAKSTYNTWSKRYGIGNRHNGLTPRNHWLLEAEKQAIVAFHHRHPLEGYRRLSYLMLDANVVAASPSTVYRVLKAAGVLDSWQAKLSKKGTGFEQPLAPHAHWHTDVSYINVAGTFYYFCSVLDGFSRYIVSWELRESMKETEIEMILQRAKERFPQATPRVISDNGPQFIAKDFKEFIRLSSMTHVRTSPYYPQSNGKIERFHKSLKTECVREQSLNTPEEAKKVITAYVFQYNEQRLHSSIGYVTPLAKLNGEDVAIFAERKEKLAAAQMARKERRLNNVELAECKPLANAA
ncbi:MAG: IS3 family transposase [Methylococcales bacterium]|nr:IS3 family transposase [Methylococcales bacterium]